MAGALPVFFRFVSLARLHRYDDPFDMEINTCIPDQVAHWTTLLNVFLQLLDSIHWLVGLDSLLHRDLFEIGPETLNTMYAARIDLRITDIFNIAILKI